MERLWPALKVYSPDLQEDLVREQPEDQVKGAEMARSQVSLVSQVRGRIAFFA